MGFHFKPRIIFLVCIFIGTVAQVVAQQKPQWMPGQVGLNAGILPSPGFTYVNMDINYDAGTYNDFRGKAIPVTGTYNVWAIENIFYYVLDKGVLGGNLGFMIIFPTIATGSLVADISNPQFPISARRAEVAALPTCGCSRSILVGTSNAPTFS